MHVCDYYEPLFGLRRYIQLIDACIQSAFAVICYIHRYILSESMYFIRESK